MQETWVQSLGLEYPLEKQMVTHSRTLALEIPWTEEPRRLQSMGSQRVRHDWATEPPRRCKHSIKPSIVFHILHFNSTGAIAITGACFLYCFEVYSNYNCMFFVRCFFVCLLNTIIFQLTLISKTEKAISTRRKEKDTYILRQVRVQDFFKAIDSFCNESY